MRIAVAFSALLFASPALADAAFPDTRALQRLVSEQGYPTAIYVAGPGVSGSGAAASGMADPGRGRPFTARTPLRIASNTKTFVAATILRLHEDGLIDLDAQIRPLVSPSLARLLESDGYDLHKITIRHLLSHSAGLYDHGGDPRFIVAALKDPKHVWTRAELIGLAVAYADPQGEPGTKFRYSDDGYILLGDIIERLTGKSLAQAVRSAMRFDEIGLGETWWEVAEPAPRLVERAHQWLGNVDATGIHPSLDLYGGGGLVMSAHDLAIAIEALFGGRIFKRPETLQLMLWQGPHAGADTYRLGIFVETVGGCTAYWHSGFWGTVVYYSPSRKVAVAAATTNQSNYSNVRATVQKLIKDAHADSSCK